MRQLISKKKIITTSLTVRIENELLKEVKLKAHKQGFTLRQIVEYGFEKFTKESRNALKAQLSIGKKRPSFR